MAEVINKIIISPEAIFDYEECVCFCKLNKRLLKEEVEEYINNMNAGGRLLYVGYFRACFYDEDSGKMLMLFFYRGSKQSIMQNWVLKGICEAAYWDEDAEDDGLIRFWVETLIEELPPSEDDWVIRDRVWQVLSNTEEVEFEKVLTEVLNVFEQERDKETAKELVFLQSVYFDIRGRRPVKEKIGRNRKGNKCTRRCE